MKRGINYERELVKIFWKHGIAALRVAGSGLAPYPLPDILVGFKGKVYAIEVKSTKKDCIYIDEIKVKELLEFSKIFGAEAYLALKFIRRGWFFLKPISGKITYEDAKSNGLTLKSFIEKILTRDEVL